VPAANTICRMLMEIRNEPLNHRPSALRTDAWFAHIRLPYRIAANHGNVFLSGKGVLSIDHHRGDESKGENRLTTKLSDAGGPAPPNLQANDSARFRSNDFVARHSWFQLSDD
jgi:hypothetical protein